MSGRILHQRDSTPGNVSVGSERNSSYRSLVESRLGEELGNISREDRTCLDLAPLDLPSASSRSPSKAGAKVPMKSETKKSGALVAQRSPNSWSYRSLGDAAAPKGPKGRGSQPPAPAGKGRGSAGHIQRRPRQTLDDDGPSASYRTGVRGLPKAAPLGHGELASPELARPSSQIQSGFRRFSVDDSKRPANYPLPSGPRTPSGPDPLAPVDAILAEPRHRMANGRPLLEPIPQERWSGRSSRVGTPPASLREPGSARAYGSPGGNGPGTPGQRRPDSAGARAGAEKSASDGGGWESVSSIVNQVAPGATKEQWESTAQERQKFVIDQELQHFLSCSRDTGYLNLTRNRWQQIPKQVEYFLADHGSSMKSLNLESNCIETCPEVFAMPNLVSLNLADNRLTTVSSSFAGLSQLTTLSLEKNRLAAVPDVIGYCGSLTYLDLSHNKLQWIPESFASLRRLKTFKVERNKLSHMPLIVCSMTSLKELNFANNSITGVPSDVGKLKQLQILRLENNHLTSLPLTVGALWSSLLELYLSKNDLSHLPPSLAACRKLEVLDLSLNPLQFPPLSVVEQGLQPVLSFLGGSNDKMLFDSRYNMMQAIGEKKGEQSRLRNMLSGVQNHLPEQMQIKVEQFCSDCSQVAYDMAMTSEEEKIQMSAQNRQLMEAINEKNNELQVANDEIKRIRNQLVDSNKRLRACEKALRDATSAQAQLLEKTVMQETEISSLQEKLADAVSKYEHAQNELDRLMAPIVEEKAENAEADGEQPENPLGKGKTAADLIAENSELASALAEARKQAEAFEKLSRERKDAWLWSAQNWEKRMAERESEVAEQLSQAEARERSLMGQVERLRDKARQLEEQLGWKSRVMHQTRSPGASSKALGPGKEAPDTGSGSQTAAREQQPQGGPGDQPPAQGTGEKAD
uniref:Leucine rich repeat protein n=2 Tax=Tetraselmis sp. GSL018 TaxID=582737 RepID=A0A061SM89_9CHLO